jgi:DNA-binding winged helix-turn-helix (wHTH) protein/tetratricopeptide (TPR) repeat protein
MAGIRYRFARFEVDPAARELRRDGEIVALPARAFDCLAWLLAHRDRAVGRDELIAAVWGRVEVSDALLSHAIVTVRRTLGDSGSDQLLIRTVPRFGYRWVGELEESTEPVARSGDDGAGETPQAGAPAASSRARPEATARASGARRVAGLAVLAVGALGVAAALGWFAPRGEHDTASPRAVGARAPTYPDGVVAPVAERPDAATGGAAAPASAGEAAPALVLPATVDAPAEWTWLRFGLMDLVANRLRTGGLRTMPSENVVGLIRTWTSTDGEALLRDPRMVAFATLRILPRVRVESGQWTVRLDAVGAQRSVSADARADEPTAAARRATDELLRQLGHRAGLAEGAEVPPALDELLQRSGAAMLADQLDVARRLIAAAPEELQREPRIVQRLAQVELRSGDYDAVVWRLSGLLDRLGTGGDPALRARALVTLAAAHVREQRMDKAGEAYEEAIALRGDANDPELLGIAHLGRGIVLAQAARIDEATSELGIARIALQGAGDGLGVAQVDVNLGDFELLRHRPAAALPMLAGAAARFAALGAREGTAYALTSQVRAQRELLDPAAALATSERFWPPESHTSNRRLREELRCTRAEVLADLGRLDAAEALLDRVSAYPDLAAARALGARAEALAARLAWRRGQWADAARKAAGALRLGLADSDPVLGVRTTLLHARALRALGDGPAADAALLRLRDPAGPDAAWRGMYADLAAAEQDWAKGRREAALPRFEAAWRVAETANVPEDLAETGSAAAAAWIAAGDLDTARAVAGRIAPFAERDLRAALTQERLYRALGQDDAERAAAETVARLVGDGALPGDVAGPTP